MEFHLNLLFIVDILSWASALMLGCLFITSKSDNKKANLFLGLFLMSLSIEVIGSLLEFTEYVFYLPNTILWTIPFLFFYVIFTINHKRQYYYYFLFLLGIINNLFDIDNLFYIVSYVLNIGLLIYILYLLKWHRKAVNNYYSDIQSKTLKWITLIVYIYLGFNLLWIIEDIIGWNHEEWTMYFSGISSVLTLTMIYWIGHHGFSQNEIFKKQLFTVKDDVISISENDESDYFELLKQTIRAKQLFTNPKLNLRLLSEELHIKEKELSRLINVYHKRNFYQFINEFRVEAFKSLLQSSKAKQMSILGLAQEAGFSSKSTFYSAFKTLEGMTPTEYKKQLKLSE